MSLLSEIPVRTDQELYFKKSWMSKKRARLLLKPTYLRFATPTHKVAAWCIDFALLALFIFATSLSPLFWLIIMISYFTLLERSKLHGSIGEYLMGIEVLHDTGRPACLKHLFIRNLIYLFTFGLAALFKHKGSALHDKLAHTICLEEQP